MTAARMELDPIVRHVRALPDRDYMLPREAASILGITENRLAYLGRLHPDELGPGYVTWAGERQIFLYDEADLDQLRAYFARRRARRPPALDPYNAGKGREPVWSAEEWPDRHRRHSRATYWSRRAALLERRGDVDLAAQARSRGEQLRAELRAEAAHRSSGS